MCTRSGLVPVNVYTFGKFYKHNKLIKVLHLSFFISLVVSDLPIVDTCLGHLAYINTVDIKTINTNIALRMLFVRPKTYYVSYKTENKVNRCLKIKIFGFEINYDIQLMSKIKGQSVFKACIRY